MRGCIASISGFLVSIILPDLLALITCALSDSILYSYWLSDSCVLKVAAPHVLLLSRNASIWMLVCCLSLENATLMPRVLSRRPLRSGSCRCSGWGSTTDFKNHNIWYKNGWYNSIIASSVFLQFFESVTDILGLVYPISHILIRYCSIPYLFW